jgi:hypothetical protein
MATENNRNIKYPSKMDIIQSTRIVIDVDIKNQITSIVSNLLTTIKSKHT